MREGEGETEEVMACGELSVCLPSRESARERRSFRRMVQCSMLGSDGGCDEPRWRRERERERGRGRGQVFLEREREREKEIEERVRVEILPMG